MPRQVEADHPLQLSQGIFQLDQIVEVLLQPFRFGLSAADEWTDAGQDLDVVRISAKPSHLTLDVAIERLRVGQGLMRGEDRFAIACGKGAPVVRRAG
jgi:hypothetical protein